jgi:hypothetical protein
MTTPKRWPKNARRARDEAADRVQDAIRFLSPLIENGHHLTKTDTLIRQARALSALKDAAMWLHSAGAPIQPFEGGAPLATGDK